MPKEQQEELLRRLEVLQMVVLELQEVMEVLGDQAVEQVVVMVLVV